mmetsp:Transcript_14151/g.44250  ORF Transcript_14151/g.44250 Transcript_14151/m.44250 type:complete len:398 (-) Transcript_14151:682-1875(-)
MLQAAESGLAHRPVCVHRQPRQVRSEHQRLRGRGRRVHAAEGTVGCLAAAEDVRKVGSLSDQPGRPRCAELAGEAAGTRCVRRKHSCVVLFPARVAAVVVSVLARAHVDAHAHRTAKQAQRRGVVPEIGSHKATCLVQRARNLGAQRGASHRRRLHHWSARHGAALGQTNGHKVRQCTPQATHHAGDRAQRGAAGILRGGPLACGKCAKRCQWLLQQFSNKMCDERLLALAGRVPRRRRRAKCRLVSAQEDVARLVGHGGGIAVLVGRIYPNKRADDADAHSRGRRRNGRTGRGKSQLNAFEQTSAQRHQVSAAERHRQANCFHLSGALDGVRAGRRRRGALRCLVCCFCQLLHGGGEHGLNERWHRLGGVEVYRCAHQATHLERDAADILALQPTR